MQRERNTKKIVLISIISVVSALLIIVGVVFFAVPINVVEQYYLEFGSELSTDAKDDVKMKYY